MADTIVESAAPAEVQAKAEKLGWIPPSRFKGDPERFVDAEEYIERGETVLPIVKEHNRRLQAEVEQNRLELRRTQDALRAAQDAITSIEERHTVETQKAVEAARKQVKAQLAAASEAGDHEGVADLTEQLTLLNKADPPAPAKKPATPESPAPFVPPPELQQWQNENPWFGSDKRKTSLALGIAQELREGGETRTGRAFFDLVKVELEKTLGGGESETSPASKVEGARGGAEGGSRASGRKGFAALPEEAKAACEADAKRFVGNNKRYKTIDEWRTRYAEIYFGS